MFVRADVHFVHIGLLIAVEVMRVSVARAWVAADCDLFQGLVPALDLALVRTRRLDADVLLVRRVVRVFAAVFADGHFAGVLTEMPFSIAFAGHLFRVSGLQSACAAHC